MKALTFAGKRSVRVETVADPVIEFSTDVIVKVLAAGICGSDLHVYHERERGLDPGTPMGHELVGEVVETGSAVTLFMKGDRVVSPFTTNCGDCFYCRSGLTSRCDKGQLFGWVEKGVGLPGAQAEYARIPLADTTLLALPEGINSEEGLLLGDVLSTGYFCAEMAETKPGGVYAVIGCGPVGMMTIVGAVARGAERIYVIDAVPERLVLGERFGAIPINYENENPVEILRNATGGRGPDAVMEVVGRSSAARLAVELVRPGGIIATVGVHSDENLSFTPMEAYNKNLTYRTGRCPARRYMERLLPIVRDGKYPLGSVISHTLPLSDAVKGYELFDKKLDNCTKVVLTP